MSLNSELVAWGKLNPRLAWKVFQDLQSKGDLTLVDCDQCKKTLENARLNILDGLIDDNYDIQMIENRLSEIEVVKLGLESQVELALMDETVVKEIDFLPVGNQRHSVKKISVDDKMNEKDLKERNKLLRSFWRKNM